MVAVPQGEVRTWARALPATRALALAIVAGMALALRLRLAWESIDDIVRKSTPDDAYYYFQIARNLAHGHNVTFDGETVTNGFHPLWLVLITPVFWFADGDAMPVHIILTMGALLGAATVLLIYATLMRLTANPAASLVGAGFYALHPATVSDSVNGVESALTVCCCVLVAWLFVGRAAPGFRASPLDDAAFGAALGLMVLARTDTIFIVPPLLAYLLWRATSPGLRVRRLAGMATAGIAVVSPWLVWSLVANGTFVQVSGLASGWQQRDAYAFSHGSGLLTTLSHSLWLTKDMLMQRLMHQYFVPGTMATWPAAAATASVVAAMWFIPTKGGTGEQRRALLLISLVASGVVAALVFHAGVRWQVREWYFAPTAAVAALLLGVAVHWGAGVASRIAGDPDAVALAVVVPLFYAGVIALFVLWIRPQTPERWGPGFQLEDRLLATARWLSHNTESDARIGSFNAGILGYYSNRTVVNLDGVVNADAYRALRNCTMAEYMRRKRLTHLAEYEPAMVLAFCDDPGAKYTVVATFGDTRVWPGAFLILRLPGS